MLESVSWTSAAARDWGTLAYAPSPKGYDQRTLVAQKHWYCLTSVLAEAMEVENGPGLSQREVDWLA